MLDIGSGLGEIVHLERHKFRKVVAIDIGRENCEFLRRRFEGDAGVRVIQCNAVDLQEYVRDTVFDCVTALDVLEHVGLEECKKVLRDVSEIMKDGGRFIMSVPGALDIIRMGLGKAFFHKHSHTSYGWGRLCRTTGFRVLSIEAVRFPVVNSEFLRMNLHAMGACCIVVCIKS